MTNVLYHSISNYENGNIFQISHSTHTELSALIFHGRPWNEGLFRTFELQAALLGFDLSEKEKPFGVITETLGVVLDTSDAKMEIIKVSNKPDRSEALASTLSCIVAERKVVVRDMPSTLGRLQLAVRAPRSYTRNATNPTQCRNAAQTLPRQHGEAHKEAPPSHLSRPRNPPSRVNQVADSPDQLSEHCAQHSEPQNSKLLN